MSACLRTLSFCESKCFGAFDLLFVYFVIRLRTVSDILKCVQIVCIYEEPNVLTDLSVKINEMCIKMYFYISMCMRSF